MYSIKVNGKDPLKVESDRDGGLIVEGKLLELDLIPAGPGMYHAVHEHKGYRIEVLKLNREEKKMKLRINGFAYEIELKDKHDLLLESMGLVGANAGKLNEFKAPMPGLVLDVFVTAGSEVKKGQPLLVLEAMKMENMLKAPGDGVVKKIHVEKKQAVEKNQLLVSFE